MTRPQLSSDPEVRGTFGAAACLHELDRRVGVRANRR